MIPQAVNSILGVLGLRLTRSRQPKRVLFPPSPSEKSEIQRILRHFVATQTSGTNVSDFKQWDNYLSDSRISFFREVQQLLVDRNIDLTELRIADFGSGTGYLLRLIHQVEPSTRLSGFDSFEEANQLAKLICPAAEFHLALDSGSTQFDLIFCTEVLEHLKNPREQVRELAARCRPGGKMVFTVPNGRTDFHSARNPREDGTGYWGHINFWSPESWPLFLADALPPTAEFETGLLSSGEVFAIICLPAIG